MLVTRGDKERGGEVAGWPGKRVGFGSPLIPAAQFSLSAPGAPPTEVAHHGGGRARSAQAGAGADAALAATLVLHCY